MISAILFFAIGAISELLTLAIVIDAILSWVPFNDTLYKIRQFLGVFINPVMNPVRKLISPLTFKIGIDISPIIALILIDVAASVLSKIVAVLF